MTCFYDTAFGSFPVCSVDSLNCLKLLQFWSTIFSLLSVYNEYNTRCFINNVPEIGADYMVLQESSFPFHLTATLCLSANLKTPFELCEILQLMENGQCKNKAIWGTYPDMIAFPSSHFDFCVFEL